MATESGQKQIAGVAKQHEMVPAKPPEALLQLRVQDLEKPAISPSLGELPPAAQAAETLRHTVLEAEYALSPGGALRAWLKLLCCLGAVVLALGLLLMALIRPLATDVVAVCGSVALAFRKLAAAAAAFAAAAAILLAGTLFIVGWLVVVLLVAIGRRLLLSKGQGGGGGRSGHARFIDAD